MKKLVWIFFVFIATLQSSIGQTHKIFLGNGDTTYYSIKSSKLPDSLFPLAGYKLKRPFPDGRWIIYRYDDNLKPIIEFNYKNKKQNGQYIGYSYNNKILRQKTYFPMKDDKFIKYNNTYYSDIGDSSVIYYSKHHRHFKSCQNELGWDNFPNDSTINYKNGAVSCKEYYKKCFKTGTWKYWDENGKLYKGEVYRKDKLIKTIKY